jgi:hypothetical protein
VNPLATSRLAFLPYLRMLLLQRPPPRARGGNPLAMSRLAFLPYLRMLLPQRPPPRAPLALSPI